MSKSAPSGRSGPSAPSAPPPTASAFLARAIATFGFVGRLPLAPGTWATAITLGLWLLIRPHRLELGVVTLFVVLIGTWAAHRAESIYGHDSHTVVIDEVAGALIAVLGLNPHWYTAVGAFLFFRMFDIVKPPPIYQIQSFPGGIGVMADDVLAGIASNVVVRIALTILGPLTGGL